MEHISMLLRLGAGMLIGIAIGMERERAHRPAGMRTHFLVALGAAAVTVAGNSVSLRLGGDPLRLAAQVVSGIGFLGAGTILKEGVNVRGLTTSASLWVTACLAIAAGFGLYIEAAVGTLGALVALTFFEHVERLLISGGTMSVTSFEIVADKEIDLTKNISKVLRRHRVVSDEFSVVIDGDERRVTLTVRLKSSRKNAVLLDEISALAGVRRAEFKRLSDYSPVA